MTNRHLHHETSKAELQAEVDRLRSNLDAANMLIEWQRDYIEFCAGVIHQGAIPIQYASWLENRQRNSK